MFRKLADRLEFELDLFRLRLALCRRLNRWITEVYDEEFAPASDSFTLRDFYRGNRIAQVILNSYYPDY